MRAIRHPRRLKPALQFAALLLTLGAAWADETPPGEALRQGLYAEEVKRDPEAAAKHYAEIIAAEDRRRATVATAVFRLAEVRRGQGRKDEAIALYHRLLNEFPRAEAEATLARERLSEWGAKIPESGGGAGDPEAIELARLQAAAKDSPDLVSDADTLDKAAQKGWLKVVEFMLAHGANPYDAKEEPMMSAVYGGHLAVCSAMIAKAGVPSDEATQMEVLEEAIGSLGQQTTRCRRRREEADRSRRQSECGRRGAKRE